MSELQLRPSLCGLLCQCVAWTLFGSHSYNPIPTYDQHSNNQTDNGDVTIGFVGANGQIQSVHTDMVTLLRYLKTENDRTEQEERKWRVEGSVVRQLEFPLELWERLEESRYYRSHVSRIKSAVEGYKRNNLSFVKLLAVLDRIFNQDHDLDMELMAQLPIQEFVRMALTKQLVETDSCNALHWAVSRGGDAITNDDVDAIIDAWPEIVQQTSPEGRLPLHVAAAAFAEQPNVQVLQRIIQAYPRGLEKADDRGLLPLHYSLCSVLRPDVETIRALVEAFPEAVMVQDRNSCTPLHLAMLHSGVDERLFQIFIEHANPEELLQKQDTKGYTALHLALVTNPDNLSLIQGLVSAWPDGVKHSDHDSQSALHFAVMNSRSKLECVRLIHEKWPEAIDRRSATAMTPLHVAIKAGATMPVVSYLLDSGPSSFYSSTCPGDETLLHYLMRNPHIDVHVTRRVYEKFPSAIRRRTPEGFLPIHFALLMGVSQEVVEFLLEQWRASVKEPSRDGFTALHCATMVRKNKRSTKLGNTETHADEASPEGNTDSLISSPLDNPNNLAEQDAADNRLKEYGGHGGKAKPFANEEKDDDDSDGGISVNPDIVRLIHRRWPDALQIRSKLGTTPLFDALLSGAPYDAVEYMLRECPEALSVQAFRGFTPLHAAVLGGAAVEVLQLLFEVGDGSVIWKRCETGRTPLHWALAAGAPVEIIDALLRLRPQSSKEKVVGGSGSGGTPLHVALSARVDLEIIHRLVEAWPGAKMVRNDRFLIPIDYIPLYSADARPKLKRILSRTGHGVRPTRSFQINRNNQRASPANRKR